MTQKAETPPDYAAYATAPGENILARISTKARQQLDAELELAKANEAVSRAKDALCLIAEKELPELMAEAQQEKLTTDFGATVSVADTVRAAIPVNSAHAALEWLVENGHEQLIKRQLTILFGREDQAWAAKFERDLASRKRPLPVTRKNSVNPQTLSAWAREKMAEGEAFPMELLGVHVLKTAKIKIKKTKNPF